MDDALIMMSGRLRRGWQTFLLLDVPERVETFGLLSFSCCLLGSLGTMPLTVNLAVAVQILAASRSRSDAQLLGVCGFAAFTSVTDFLQLAHCTAWGGAMLIVNVVLKFGAASNAYRMIGEPGLDDGLDAADDGGLSSAPYRAPTLADEDYRALAVEAAGRQASVGSSEYRAV